ncbi:F0F1-type ATP synthase assembly protein I [Desulfohalotomaculum tongense]|uniref:hypothetical protein n=1 Tax=Desulforadius tongensis TaxID=1216062 RepID=UPI00195ED704|nr:hypothetical protein [Desulforadius tongensis]MBM7854951.1 F0F1-type ATP synthase assembly protein I [Desulforadius tongensis]
MVLISLILAIWICLFVSVFALLYLFLVPASEYDVSPAAITVGHIREKIESFFGDEEYKEKLSIIKRSPDEIVKYAVFFGVGFGFLVTMIGLKFLGIFTLLLGVLAAIVGIVVTKVIMENEFKKWQDRLFMGVPSLVNFMPVFLDVGALTVRESMMFTLSFLPEPLKGEMEAVISRISRTGQAREALNILAKRAKHPVIDAVCFRIGMAWDSKVEPGMFDDLAETIDNENEKAVARATAAKSGFFALIAVVALLGAIPIFIYPIFIKCVVEQMSRGLGF